MEGMLKLILILITAISVTMGCAREKRQETTGHKSEPVPPIVSFCSAIDYADTASLHQEKIMAKHMTDIVKMMMGSDSTATSRALDIFFKGLGGDGESLRSAAKLANLYLSNPASPVRNETLYIRFLESLLNAPDIPEDVIERANEKMRKTKLNMPGTIATDFRYIDREGNQGNLHSLKAEQTMLVFYDPECPHCPEILKNIENDPKVNTAIDAGALKVIAVYAEGKRDVWEKTKAELPFSWSVAYDLTGVLDNELYDLPAMPIVYLLDAEKRVLFKDMPW